MEKLFSFEDLKVWQKAVDFAEVVVRAIDDFDAPRKHYRLIEQLESAATSPAMNLAEGKGVFQKKSLFISCILPEGLYLRPSLC